MNSSLFSQSAHAGPVLPIGEKVDERENQSGTDESSGMVLKKQGLGFVFSVVIVDVLAVEDSKDRLL